MPNLGHHDEPLHAARDGPDVVRHGVLAGQGVKRADQVLRGGDALPGRKVHAHEEALGHGVAELLQVEDVVAVGSKDGGDGVDDARLVGARQREDEVAFVGHGGIGGGAGGGGGGGGGGGAARGAWPGGGGREDEKRGTSWRRARGVD